MESNKGFFICHDVCFLFLFTLFGSLDPQRPGVILRTKKKKPCVIQVQTQTLPLEGPRDPLGGVICHMVSESNTHFLATNTWFFFC